MEALYFIRNVVCVCVCVSCSVVSDSLRPHGLQPARLLFNGILQARILGWVAISFSKGSSWPRDRTQVSCTAGRCFTIWATREALQCSHKSAKDLTLPCLDVWFYGWWVKITPSLLEKTDTERQEKWQKAKRSCVSATWHIRVQFYSVPYRKETVLRAEMACLRAHSFAFRNPPSFISLTAGEDDKLLCPTELYWFGTQHCIEED